MLGAAQVGRMQYDQAGVLGGLALDGGVSQ
jgi:hypothetical protein